MSEAKIRLTIEPLDGGGYVATSPGVPGLVAEGRTITEAVEIAQELARKIAESCLDHADPLPPALPNALTGGSRVDTEQPAEGEPIRVSRFVRTCLGQLDSFSSDRLVVARASALLFAAGASALLSTAGGWEMITRANKAPPP